MKLIRFASFKTISLGLLSLLVASPLILYSGPPRGGGGGSVPHVSGGNISRGGPSGAPVFHGGGGVGATVNRFNHGSIRHSDTHIIKRPVEAPRHFEPQQHAIVHRDVDVDVNRPRYWHDFSFGARQHRLHEGFVPLSVGGVPYLYYGGIYYQQEADDYVEVYPPDGAVVGALPDGAIEIGADDLVYYYAGGAFYVQQDGGFVVVPAPIGVAVPELPPGALPATIDNRLGYQFNGVYYEPVFANGVTQYVTVRR